MKRFFLIGLPGSGKSYWGKIWAKSAELPFIDLDQYIEENEQLPIADIFTLKGEKYFRDLETHYLKELSTQHQNFIIACGGGTPCFNDNMEFINQKGISVFINTNTQVIIKHLIEQTEMEKRPLFKTLKSEEEVKDYLENLLNDRISYYKKARYEIIPGHLNQTIDKFLEIGKS